MDTPRIEYVRELWRRFTERGLDAVLEIVPDDVVWEPLAAEGRVLRGPDELREHLARLEREGRPNRAESYAFEEVGDTVIVTGSMRQFHEHGFHDRQPAWVYWFSEDRLVRVVGFPSYGAARAAIADESA
jgi:hypothetical protein